MILFLINIASFLLFAVFGSLVMCGLYKATREKMVLSFWSKYWEEKEGENFKRPEWIVKPLSSCVYCYASIYGSLIYWVIGSALFPRYVYISVWQAVVLWFSYTLATCALNGIIIKKVI